MADDTGDDEDRHKRRVQDAFDSLHGNVDERLDDASRRTLADLRAAAEKRDMEGLRSGLNGVREQHGWLYRELAEHPVLSSLMNELALWGF